MIKRLILAACMLSCAVSINSPLTVSAAKQDRGATSSDVDKDNTKVNKQEKEEGALTADQQGNSKADLETTKRIRTAIIEDKTLSQYAHNIKIITRDGKVTLKGPVRSEQEKRIVAKIAAKVAGKKNLTNELDVAPPKKQDK